VLGSVLASTERRNENNRDSDGKVLVIYNYNGYAMKNMLPIMLVQRLLFNLRDHFPERLRKDFIVDASFSFRFSWSLMRGLW
jgi:hypothetical protein